MTETPATPEPVDADLEAFWVDARVHANLTELGPALGEHPLAAVRPPAWSFGATPAHADDLLDLVLRGTKTATAGALWDYEAEGEQLPTPGQLSIVLDGRGRPRALIRTDAVEIRPFDQVDDEHAYAEGEGDRSLRYWRDVHRAFFERYATHDRGFSEDMPVVLERFSVLYAPEWAAPAE